MVFYVIDGAAASQMSVYGYNRRTTPHLERLAVQGAVLESAYSNSFWTRPSTASFMSSLQHISLGGLKDFGNPPPNEVPTMAEHLHRAGYQTAVLAANPNAGSMSNLDRGVDRLLEDFSGAPEQSSAELHQQFWEWRTSYPGARYWVHFQTTDVHEHDNGKGVAPFDGLFVSVERRNAYLGQRKRLSDGGGAGPYSPTFEKTGIDRQAFFEVQRGLYDEAMAHQDAEIGRLVERIQGKGEWETRCSSSLRITVTWLPATRTSRWACSIPCLRSLHDGRADLADKYTRLLERQFAAHRLLGQRFARAEVSSLTPDQLRTLRALGYIQ